MAKRMFNVENFEADFAVKGIKGENKTQVSLPSGHKMSLTGHVESATDSALADLVGRQTDAVKVSAPKLATETSAVLVRSGKFTPTTLAGMLRRATGLVEIAAAVDAEPARLNHANETAEERKARKAREKAERDALAAQTNGAAAQ